MTLRDTNSDVYATLETFRLLLVKQGREFESLAHLGGELDSVRRTSTIACCAEDHVGISRLAEMPFLAAMARQIVVSKPDLPRKPMLFGRCDQGGQPCRVCGICLGAMEISHVLMDELLSPDALARAKLIAAAKAASTKAVKSLSAGRMPLPQELQEEAVRYASAISEATRLGDKLDVSIRAKLSQHNAAKRGDKLLNAVLQHLHWGGFTPTEIAALGILPNPGELQQNRDRIEFLVKNDCRSLHIRNPTKSDARGDLGNARTLSRQR